MSCTTLYAAFEDGDMKPVHRYSNSYCGAFMIWTYMIDRYLAADKPTGPWLGNEAFLQKLWDLVDDLSIPFAERVVLATTFDGVLVRGSEREKIAVCLMAVSRLLPPQNHLDLQFDDIFALPDTARAIGWQQTSVAPSFWCVSSSLNEYDERPYNIDTDTDHWWLFDEIEQPEDRGPVNA
jgi:hypothetical protein